MSASELEDSFMCLDNLVSQEETKDVLQTLDDFCTEEAAAAVSIAPGPSVRWRKRDIHGNEVFLRPRSSRKNPNSSGRTQKTNPPRSASDPSCEVAFASETVESFLQDLQQSLSCEEQEEARAPPLASLSWATRKSLFSESWRAERPRLVNSTVAQEHVGEHTCQQCGDNQAVIRCQDCLPHPFYCADCDVSFHTRHVLHNRDSTVAGFFQPLPPTHFILDKTLSDCVRPVPVELPEQICLCPSQSMRVSPGKAVVVVTMNGRYDLNMPDLFCEACGDTWSADVDDLNRSGFWPATLNFATIYAIDVFYSFEEMKMAAPGLSCQAFLKMLDQRTVRFGRTGKISADSFLKSFFEWEAVRYEVDNICKEEPFTCPACTPDMLAVSVDGNRKHYRFKNAARSEQEAIFEGVFIAKDEDVTKFVDYIHSTTKHVSGRGTCGGEWSAARETSQRSAGKVDEEGLELAVCRHGALLAALNMYRGEIFAYPLFLQDRLSSQHIHFFCMDVTCKYWPYLQKVTQSCPELQHLLAMKPFLSVFHAKAHDFKCEVKWSGAYQDGAGLTLGEEVEQCNAFLSRIAVTTKHMSKAGRTDMLTLMAMRWNQQKFSNLSKSLVRRYQKTAKSLTAQLQNLEEMKGQLAVSENKMKEWVSDVKEWAEDTSSSSTADVDALANKIEVLVTSIKRRSQRLYKDADGSKARSRFRRKIREEKGILSSLVEQYNRMVPSSGVLCLETILSEETAWPWQLQHSDSVDLKTKRKVFDAVMAVQRLEEEKRILVREMEHHWRFLSSRAETLRELSRLDFSETESSWDLTEEGLKGLQSIICRKLNDISEMRKHARQCYMTVLTGAEDVNFLDDPSDDDYICDSDTSE